MNERRNKPPYAEIDKQVPTGIVAPYKGPETARDAMMLLFLLHDPQTRPAVEALPNFNSEIRPMLRYGP